MARLDRLATVKGLAQLGATLGREFSYALLQAVAPWDEATLQRGCTSWWRRSSCTSGGCRRRRRIVFKHALIQDAAYQSLLQEHPPAVPSAHCPGVGGALSRDRRDPARTAGASLHRGGPPASRRCRYWQQAGQRALQRSANLEAVSHLTRAWQVLAHPAGDAASGRSRNSTCRLPGGGVDGHQGPCGPGGGADLCPGTCAVRAGRRDPAAVPDAVGLLSLLYDRGCCRRRGSWGNSSCGWRSTRPTQPASWRRMGPSGIPCSTWATTPRPDAPGAGHRPHRPGAHRDLCSARARRRVCGASAMAALMLWCLGYPAQAVQRSQEALALAQTLAHPFSLAVAQTCGLLHHRRPRPGGPGAGRRPC